MKIDIKADCGNSPKKEFIKEYNIAFMQGNAEFIIEHASDDIIWDIFGDKRIEGKKAFTKEINAMAAYQADELTVNHIITHGKEAACNGEIVMGGKRYVFSDVYVFVSAGKNIIKRMYSYVLPQSEG